MTHVVIIGNGFGGVYTLRNLHNLFHHKKSTEHIEITLIGENNYFLFTPLLHEVATGGINPSNIIEPIRKVLGCCVDRFYLGKAEAIDLEKKTVKVPTADIPYDYLVLAPGAETNFYGIKGAEEYSFPLKSIADALRIKNKCISLMERAMCLQRPEERQARKNLLHFVVIGGGPTGVEMAGELQDLKKSLYHYYPKSVVDDFSITLIQKGPALVPMFGPKISKKSLKILQKKDIEVLLDTGVTEVTATEAVLENGNRIQTEMVIWVGGIKPTALNFNQEVAKSPDGRLLIDQTLQLQNHPGVFAIGDAAMFPQEDFKNGVPALAQVAEKESLAVAKNIMLLMKDEETDKFFYKSSGMLLSLGRWTAVAEIFHFHFSGYFAWLVWRTIYLSKLISWRKKVRVFIDWTMNIFSPKDISRI